MHMSFSVHGIIWKAKHMHMSFSVHGIRANETMSLYDFGAFDTRPKCNTFGIVCSAYLFNTPYTLGKGYNSRRFGFN